MLEITISNETKGPRGYSHPFLGMGSDPLELVKLASFRLKLGKSISSLYMKIPLLD